MITLPTWVPLIAAFCLFSLGFLLGCIWAVMRIDQQDKLHESDPDFWNE